MIAGLAPFAIVPDLEPPSCVADTRPWRPKVREIRDREVDAAERIVTNEISAFAAIHAPGL